MQNLTHSRQDSFKACRKKHWFSYELGLRPSEDAKALRMGTAYHHGQETLSLTGDIGQACDRIRAHYEGREGLENELDYELDYERETVLRMLCGYDWRWANQPLEHVAAELEFRLPLINPATGAASKLWQLAGKIDGIVRLEDGRLAVIEYKFLGEEIDPDSSLWKRLKIDHQISLYVLAARRLGHDVHSVLFVPTRKPTIKPTAVPILDSLGAKVVLDANGERVKTAKGVYRETGDKERGYVLQTRPMTPDEWGEKLSADIAERPNYYFARTEVARLDQDLAEYESELWDIQKTMRDAQVNNKHYRTCNRETCQFCSYFGLCTSGFDPAGPAPEGFVKLANINPELSEHNVHTSPATSQEVIATPASETVASLDHASESPEF